jgi:hypothetical protein
MRVSLAKVCETELEVTRTVKKKLHGKVIGNQISFSQVD